MKKIIAVLLCLVSLAWAQQLRRHESGDHYFPGRVFGDFYDAGGEVINVKNRLYANGAKGDGVTDDTTAIKAALDSVPNRRGHFVFPAGTYKFTDGLRFTRVDANNGAYHPGAIIEGAGRDKTILEFTGTGYAFVLNDGTGSVNGDASQFVFKNLTIKINSPALGAIEMNDPSSSNSIENVRFRGYSRSAGTAVVMNGQTNCVCENHFDLTEVRDFQRGMWFSGFSNAHTLEQSQCLSVGDDPATTPCYDFSAMPRNATCHAAGVPWACCTGPGTGSGCTDDTQAGSDNLIQRVEIDGNTSLGVRLDNQANRNILMKVHCDGCQRGLVAANAIDTMVFSSQVNGALGGPVLSGNASTETAWFGTNRTNGTQEGGEFWLGQIRVVSTSGGTVLEFSDSVRFTDFVYGGEGANGNLRLITGSDSGIISMKRSSDAQSAYECSASDLSCRNYGSRRDANPQSLVVPSDGTGAAATATLVVTNAYVKVDCQDIHNCNVTMSETGVNDGQIVQIVNTSANGVVISDNGGVSELATTMTLGVWDTLTLKYVTDRWVETDRSDN